MTANPNSFLPGFGIDTTLADLDTFGKLLDAFNLSVEDGSFSRSSHLRTS